MWQVLLAPQVESGSGLTPDEPDTCRESHSDNSDSDVGTSGNADNPSTVLTNETEDAEFPPNPSFVVINHEMETPEGIEGPMLVYVNPTAFDYKTEATVGTNGLSNLAPTPGMENENISQVPVAYTIYHTRLRRIPIFSLRLKI